MEELTKLNFATDPRVQVGGSLAANVANFNDAPSLGVTRRWLVQPGPAANPGLRNLTVRVVHSGRAAPAARPDNGDPAMVTTPSSTESGFSLIELLIVTAMTGVIMGAAVTIATSVQRTYQHQLHDVAVEQEARYALDWMSRTIVSAGSNPYSVNITNCPAVGISVMPIRLDPDGDGIHDDIRIQSDAGRPNGLIVGAGGVLVQRAQRGCDDRPRCSEPRHHALRCGSRRRSYRHDRRDIHPAALHVSRRQLGHHGHARFHSLRTDRRRGTVARAQSVHRPADNVFITAGRSPAGAVSR